jgi:hypothetical protein
VGGHLTRSLRNDFYLGAGPYVFTADPNTLWGGKVRINYKYKDYFSLEASYSYDHIFKNIVQGTVMFSYPFGNKMKRKGEGCPKAEDLSLARAVFAPYRFEIPVVEIRKKHHAARDPNSGKPINFWFVNNTSHSDGTIESPFPTLAQAQAASGPNDVIYVFPGDGTSNGMNAGITLQDGQKLFGSGMVQHIRTKEGKIRIPAHSKTAPTISNVGPIVTLGNNNEVSGFFMVDPSPAGFAILGTSSNGAYIHDNVISTGFQGIGMNGFGNITIKNNLIIGTGPLGLNNGIVLNVLDGQFANINITRNTVTNFGFAITVQPLLAMGTSTASVNISNNTVSQFLIAGITLNNGMTGSTFRITNNVINDTVSTGGALQGSIVVNLTNAGNVGTYFIGNNVINTTTTQTAINSIIVRATGASTQAARISITNNTMTTGLGSGDIGINMNINGSPAVFCSTITGNTVTLLGATLTNGMNLTAIAPGAINIDDFSNNIAPSVVMSGVNLVAAGTCGQ